MSEQATDNKIDAICNAIISEVVDSAYEWSRVACDVFGKAKEVATAKLNEVQMSSDDLQTRLEALDETLIDALADADFVTCELSGNLIHMDHSVTVNHNRNRDVVIIAEHFSTFQCDDCNNNFYDGTERAHRAFRTSSYETDHGTVCETCFEESYGSCQDCGENYHSDNLQWHEGNDEQYCSSCYPHGLDCVTNRINLPRAATSSKDSLAVGWEIEFYPADHASVPSSEHVERVYRDGSLSSEGRELTTQPALPEQWKARLNGLDDALDGGYIGADCGGHLHVDARYLHSLLWGNSRQIVDVSAMRYEIDRLEWAIRNLRSINSVYDGTELANELQALNRASEERRDKIRAQTERPDYLTQIHVANVYYQNVLRLLCTENRNNSTYAQPQKYMNVNFDKYMAYNVSGLHHQAERKTIEFRLWGGTIDSDDLYHRAEICEAIVRKLTQLVEQLKSDSEVVQREAKNFLQRVQGDNLITQEGFWDLFHDGQASFDTLKATAKELGLSEAWINWARKSIIARAPSVPVAA